VGQTVETPKGTLAVAQYKHRVFYDGFEPVPETGDEYAAIKVVACNRSKAPVGVDPHWFELELPDGKVAAPAGLEVRRPALRLSLIQPDHCVRGWVTYALPERERPILVHFESEPGPSSIGPKAYTWRVPPKRR
jgi:hypothetical protein